MSILIVLDTNILVSALISRSGNEAGILRALRDGRLIACVALEILLEYADVLGRPHLRFDKSEVRDVLGFLQRSAIIVPLPTDSPTSPDPGDTMFIACAIAANAAFLVTGNRRHFPEPRYGAAEIVNARELLARLPVP